MSCLIGALGCCATASAVSLAGAASAAPGAASARHRLGLLVDPNERARHLFAHSAPPSTAWLPASVDLTANAPAAGDQGAVNSCVSWAIDYTAMGYYLKRDGIAGLPLAPMFTYSQVPGGHQNQGTYFSDTFALAAAQGVDSRWDYTSAFAANYAYATRPTAAQVANADKWRLSDYSWLDVTDVTSPSAAWYFAPATETTEIKSALAAGQPVVLGIPVYDGFFDLDATHSRWDRPVGEYVGGHAVTALGYTAYGVVIENSWGSWWGAKGFATLSWAFVTSEVSTAVAIGQVAPGRALSSPQPEPAVQSVSPDYGSIAGGRVVTLAGTNLSPYATVLFGGVAGTRVGVDASRTHLTVRTPAHPSGTVPVIVDGPGGVTSPLAAARTYRFERTPTVQSVSTRASPLLGGVRVVIAGRDLDGASVTFAQVTAKGSVNPAGTAVTAVVPRRSVAGTVPLTVATAHGSTSAGSFTYVAPPAVTHVTPTTGSAAGGPRVIITGSHLWHATATIGARPAAVAASSPTRLVVIAPRGTAGTQGAIVVRTVGGAVRAGVYTWS